MAGKLKLLVILGPTASGKTALGIRLAKKFRGEIVSADSRQIYTELDLLSGKESDARVPQHCIDVASLRRRYTVANYKKDAARAIADIAARGKLPIMVGGTGFYIDAVVRDIMIPNVEPDPALRARLAKKSPAELLRALRRLDPTRARTIDPHNPRRLIRAIEIARAIGRVPPPSETSPYHALKIGISLPEGELKKRISSRLDERFRAGMASEVQRLHTKGVSWARLEELGLEPRYVSRFVRGTLTEDETRRRLRRETASYAKRQLRWFKRDGAILWFNDPKDPRIERAVRAFVRGLRESNP